MIDYLTKYPNVPTYDLFKYVINFIIDSEMGTIVVDYLKEIERKRVLTTSTHRLLLNLIDWFFLFTEVSKRWAIPILGKLDLERLD